MVGPVKEPFCRVHRENSPCRPLSPISTEPVVGGFGVLAGSAIWRTGTRNRKRRKVNPLGRDKQ